jgi:hypothetical protein
MTTQTYFLAMAFGLPLTLLVLAMLAGAFYRGDYAKLLDWRQTRSARREAELQHDDLQQMLAALNRYRRKRGAPERSLEQVTRHSRASRLYVDALTPPEDWRGPDPPHGIRSGGNCEARHPQQPGRRP